jgi:hypothetical protein
MAITKQFPGSAKLEDTCRALKVAQQDDTANLTTVEGIENVRTNNTKVNLNVATFDQVNRASKVLDDLLCIDVSTVDGAKAALAANATHTKVGAPGQNFKMWVQDKLTDVQVFARKTPAPAA